MTHSLYIFLFACIYAHISTDTKQFWQASVILRGWWKRPVVFEIIWGQRETRCVPAEIDGSAFMLGTFHSCHDKSPYDTALTKSQSVCHFSGSPTDGVTVWPPACAQKIKASVRVTLSILDLESESEFDFSFGIKIWIVIQIRVWWRDLELRRWVPKQKR